MTLAFIHWGPPTDAMCHAWNIYRHKVHPFIKSILTKRDGKLATGNGKRHKDTHTHTYSRLDKIQNTEMKYAID